jgi:NADPH:quinone reductase-like Zn-dependent oxidoreductase
MKAMLIKAYGDPDVFYPGETQMPVIQEDEILIKVYGSSVNPVDTGLRRGTLKSFVRLKLPAVLGVDASGVVVEVGKKVNKFKRGDKVYAFTGIAKNGGYGEYLALPDSFAATVPENLNIVDAGVVPGVGMTAYEAFTLYAPIKPGMRVLINGATGGAGTYAIQIAKHFSAEVTSVCSTEKIELAIGLGADKIIDYKKQNILNAEEKYDVILNCVRGIGFRKFLNLLRPGGKSLVIAGSPVEIPIIKLSNLFSSKKTIPFFVKTDGRVLEGLSNLIQKDRVKPVIEKAYLWKDLAYAHYHVETGEIAGKSGVSMADLIET